VLASRRRPCGPTSVRSPRGQAPTRLSPHLIRRADGQVDCLVRRLDERGLVDKRDKPRYLLEQRARISRQLERWLEKISTEIERQTAVGREVPRAGSEDYVRELQRIALGNDAHARTQDRLVALRQLIALGVKGETAYLETPVEGRLGYWLMKRG
jgi:hypothetical protein